MSRLIRQQFPLHQVQSLAQIGTLLYSTFGRLSFSYSKSVAALEILILQIFLEN